MLYHLYLDRVNRSMLHMDHKGSVVKYRWRLCTPVMFCFFQCWPLLYGRLLLLQLMVLYSSFHILTQGSYQATYVLEIISQTFFPNTWNHVFTAVPLIYLAIGQKQPMECFVDWVSFVDWECLVCPICITVQQWWIDWIYKCNLFNIWSCGQLTTF